MMGVDDVVPFVFEELWAEVLDLGWGGFVGGLNEGIDFLGSGDLGATASGFVKLLGEGFQIACYDALAKERLVIDKDVEFACQGFRELGGEGGEED